MKKHCLVIGPLIRYLLQILNFSTLWALGLGKFLQNVDIKNTYVYGESIKVKNLDVSVLPSRPLTSTSIVHQDVKSTKCLNHLVAFVIIGG